MTICLLLFFLVAFIPLFILFNCCSRGKKEKAKGKDGISMKLDVAKKEDIPDPYVSKTTNKVAGLGPDDPDLISARLMEVKAPDTGGAVPQTNVMPAKEMSSNDLIAKTAIGKTQ